MSTQEPRSTRQDWDTVVADDLRPAGNGKDCFYCGTPLGGKHKEDCVIPKCAGWYHVAIRNNATGEVRMYRNDLAWDEASMYQWTDGNYGCDCNRTLFWYRAAGDEAEGWKCGDTGFSALYAELPDGTRIPIDESPERRGGGQ